MKNSEAGKARVLYFVPERAALEDGVLHAQVFAPARFLSRKGQECLFVGAETSTERAAAAERLVNEDYGIPARVYPVYSHRIPHVSALRTAFRASRAASRVIRDFAPTHVYTRAFTISPVVRRLARACRAVCVLDVRGVASEEKTLRHGRGLVYRVVRGLELHEIQKADRLACVSRNLRDWIRGNTGRSDAIVIPSCVDLTQFGFRESARAEIRTRFGLSNRDRLMCYCGGTGRWQRVGDIVKLFTRIAGIAAHFRFLFVSEKDQSLRTMCADAGLPSDRCFFIRCPHREVASYLSAADAGVIMRDDTAVNNVASPVKVGEYLGCGLPVILTRGIGDYSEAVAAAGVGLLLDEQADTARQVVAFVEKLDSADMRTRAREFAVREVSWETHLESFRILFGNGTGASTSHH